MSKRATPLGKPEIMLDQHASVPLYRQLYERLRGSILSGQLQAGTRLPSTRVLASSLGVSRTTTALAYEQLLLEGYLESRVGDGTRVARLQPEQGFQGSSNAHALDATDPSGMPPAVLARRGQVLSDMPYPEGFYGEQASRGTSLFLVGQPDVTCFPYATWARLLARHARHSLQAVSFYQQVQGYLPLRQAIATHIGLTRGVHCSPEQIILTTGAQGALDLVARVLLDPGEPAWVEDPGYSGARGALLAAGAQLVPVPVDEQGLDVEAGRQLCPEARLAISTPSHQFPTGVTMTLSRRLALLEWSREAHAWIVEDDYDSEYRFSGRPLEALHGLDRAGRVLYIGTFSKVLFPSLRLGYLVAPPELLKGLIAMHRLIAVHLPLLEQMALADFLVEGYFARHVRRMRQLYRERCHALVDALTRELGDMLEVSTSVILKTCQLSDEFAHGLAALRIFDGRGIARLLECDEEQEVMLLERLQPGTMLELLVPEQDEQATSILAGVMRQLWRPAPAEHTFPTVEQLGQGLTQLRARYAGGYGPFPPRLVDEAMDLFAMLSASAPQTMLLHGDLQHHNVLRSGDAWLAIDPKGVVGDPGYEVGASFYNPMPRILEVPDLEQMLARRVAQLSEELGIERARIRGWGLAQCVLNAWDVVVNDQLSMNPRGILRCAEILSRLTV